MLNKKKASHEIHRQVVIPSGKVFLDGELALPPEPRAVVLFAHGSGSGRLSPRNRFVANQLRETGLGTLLFDLLSAQEEKRDAITAQWRFDIPLLSQRLVDAIDWLAEDVTTRELPVGLFGASTGAAAALYGAVKRPEEVAAVVSRGGRVDMAEDVLDLVRAPTLLIVGENDTDLIPLNQFAYDRLAGEKQMQFVPNAGHLFEEPGALEQVAQLASRWFGYFLGKERGEEAIQLDGLV